LASTGIRIGVMHTLKVEDLEKIDDIYKIIVYAGGKEEYFAFCTPECAIGIDNYLDLRKRRGEKITGDSYRIVKNLVFKLKVSKLSHLIADLYKRYWKIILKIVESERLIMLTDSRENQFLYYMDSVSSFPHNA
jgi:integrase